MYTLNSGHNVPLVNSWVAVQVAGIGVNYPNTAQNNLGGHTMAEKTTTIWECKCAKCGFSWTDSDDNTTCPECGSDEGSCIKTEIPSTPVMPND